MTFLESSLEDIIFNALPGHLQERGLYCADYDYISRQVHLGSYGRADLVTYKLFPTPESRYCRRTIDVTVYELKQDRVNTETLLQGIGYMKGIEVLASKFNLKKTDLNIRLVLIGRSFNRKDNFCFLPDYCEKITAYTYSYHIDGIRFDEISGYMNTGNEFSEQAINRATNAERSMIREMYRQWALKELPEPEPEETEYVDTHFLYDLDINQ